MKMVSRVAWRGVVTFFLVLAGFLASVAFLAETAPVSKGRETFLLLYVWCFFLFLLCYRLFPDSLPAWVQWGVILGASILARLVLLPTPPLDDVNRYVWDGYVFNHGVNPYLLSPDDPRLSHLAEQLPEVWLGMKHKTATACYPPLATLLFSLGASINPSLFLFKVLVLWFDLATTAALGLMLRAKGLHLRRLILYAFNPLVLVFVAGEGHLDPIQGFFLILALFLMALEKQALGFLTLGCAVGTKYFSGVVAPFLVQGRNWKQFLFLLIVPLLSYVPFWETGLNLFGSLGDFVTYYSFNGPIHWILTRFLGRAASLAGLVVLLSLLLWIIFLLQHDPLRSAYLAMGSVLVCMPILNPWYLLWLTPFLTLFPSRGWLYLHLAVVPGSHLASLGLAQQSTYWLLLEFLPFAALLLWDTFARSRKDSGVSYPAVRRLSIVIPTFNEQGVLGRCLQALSTTQMEVKEVIVADGGSTDGTVQEARDWGALVVQSRKGRGVQIREGVRLATGDAVLVLHADTILRDGAVQRLISALHRNPGAMGGALGMEYEESSLRFKALASLNNMRARLVGISFGDQGQFFRREPVEALGGFPSFMLMEDVELSMRLRGAGPVLFVPKGVTVSPRRWEQRSFVGGALKIIRLVVMFLIQRRLGLLDPFCETFHKRYYGHGPSR